MYNDHASVMFVTSTQYHWVVVHSIDDYFAGSVSVSLPAPGVVIPQLASTAQPPPGKSCSTV